jgi:hypothetical protein
MQVQTVIGGSHELPSTVSLEADSATESGKVDISFRAALSDAR